MDTAKSIHKLSGGVPKFIEVISPNVQEARSVIGIVLDLLEHGEFDDLFENMTKFIAETAKRDYTIMLQAVKCIEFQELTTVDIANCLNSDVDSAYVIAEELVKMGILRKRKEGRKAYYSVVYPIYPMWLSLRIQPEKSVYQLIASKFGITLESYVKELFQEYCNKSKSIEIWDDDEGTYLMGSIDHIKFEPTRIVRGDKVTSEFGGAIDIDLVIETRDGRKFIVEVKSTGIKINKKIIEKLVKTKNRLKGNYSCIIIVNEPTGFKTTILAEAIKNNVIILTGEALKLLAKKINFPHW